jgi:hypothetical protein
MVSKLNHPRTPESLAEKLYSVGGMKAGLNKNKT